MIYLWVASRALEFNDFRIQQCLYSTTVGFSNCWIQQPLDLTTVGFNNRWIQQPLDSVTVNSTFLRLNNPKLNNPFLKVSLFRSDFRSKFNPHDNLDYSRLANLLSIGGPFNTISLNLRFVKQSLPLWPISWKDSDFSIIHTSCHRPCVWRPTHIF